MSASTERGQQQSQGNVYHPQLKLAVSDLTSNATHLGVSSTAPVSNLVNAVGLNSFLRSTINPPMQIQRNPQSFATNNPSSVNRNPDANSGSTPSISVGGTILKPNHNAVGRDLYPSNPLSGFSAGINISGPHAPSTTSAYLPNSQQYPSHSQAQFQRLKVEDALSYLDQVKLQFGSKPHVYNDFLDIMKEFKSQAIDTPGVIQRVSHLFRGHPNLIVGFNTFLPPGYKIEVHGECGERVSISTPSGQSHFIAHEEQPLTNHVGSNINLSGSSSANDNNRSVIMNGQSKPVSVQPLEFNHAISYVNKIKMRFINQPEIYKNFLEILHTYQKEQREIKEGGVPIGRRTLSEREVYDMVARLFANEDDLLREFSQFLPDATAQSGLIQVQQAIQGTPSLTLSSGAGAMSGAASSFSHQPSNSSAYPTSTNFKNMSPSSRPYNETPSSPPPPPPSSKSQVSISTASPRPDVSVIKRSLKDSPKDTTASPPKKHPRREILNSDNANVVETVSCGSLHEYEFFDKIRKSIKDEESYRNFLRLLVLYNQEIISKIDLMQMLTPVFGKHIEFSKWFREFLGYNELTSANGEFLLEKPTPEERIVSDLAMEIDYASCTRYGVSYRALPKSYVHPKSSGRTPLCDEVLNDTWVSFPSWQSEDIPFISSKKSQYEENIYRTEDERFELDNIIETNNATIETLEGVMKKLSSMSPDDAKTFQLDDTLGSRSRTSHQRAIKRLYGDKVRDVIDGLMKNPSVVVPIVLERLKVKDQEWREAQKGFNRIWREQNEKHYWKSLDHQGINFKQNDLKFVRSKALLNQIETLFEDRRELIEEGVTPIPFGAHLEVVYPKDGSIFYDVNDLLIHHVKRQAALQKDEKYKIKKLLKVTLPQLFGFQCETLSDDENGSDEKEDDDARSNDNVASSNRNGRHSVKRKKPIDTSANNNCGRSSSCSEHSECATSKLSFGNQNSSKKNENKIYCGYSLTMMTNPWYVFLRLHHILSERLGKLKSYCNQMIVGERLNVDDESHGPADALKYRPKNSTPPKDFYPTLLQLIKNVLDGQIDNAQFEDSLRDIFIIHAYIAFTMDKIVQTMVKQLQLMVTEEECATMNDHYEKWCALGGAGSCRRSSLIERKLLEEQYQREAERLAMDQNCFKIVFFHDEQKISFELLDTETDETNDDEDLKHKSKRWSLAYAREFTGPSSTSADSFVDILDALVAKPVLLCRNVRKTKISLKNDQQNSRKNSKEDKFTKETDKQSSSSTPQPQSTPVVENVDVVDQQQPSTSAEDKSSNNNESTDVLNESLPELLPPTETGKSVQNATYINNRLKILYVPRLNEDIYRPGALLRAQKTRLKSTEVRNRRFCSWHERWTLANVSMGQARLTDDWFMGRSDEMVVDSSVCIQRIQETSLNRPPFLALYRYLSPQSQNSSMIGLSQIR